jgi:hypothetical protein
MNMVKDLSTGIYDTDFVLVLRNACKSHGDTRWILHQRRERLRVRSVTGCASGTLDVTAYGRLTCTLLICGEVEETQCL